MTGWPLPALVPADTELIVTAGLRPLVTPVVVATDMVGWNVGDARVVVAVLPGVPVATRAHVPVSVQSVGGSKEAASDLARAVHAAMLGLPGVPGVNVQAVSAQTYPYPIPSADAADGVSRYTASYLVLVSSTPA